MKTRKQIPDAHKVVDPQSVANSQVKSIIQEYNNLYASQKERCQEILQVLFARLGSNSVIEQPFQCEYGCNIYIGKNFYANTGCLFDDHAKIVIGDNVMFGPNVTIYTSAHPFSVEKDTVNSLVSPVIIGNDVWIGGNVIIMPGVIIGNNSLVGPGSVVLNNIPPDVIAVGNPAMAIKKVVDL